MFDRAVPSDSSTPIQFHCCQRGSPGTIRRGIPYEFAGIRARVRSSLLKKGVLIRR